MMDKLYCSQCGKELELDMQFCPSCGKVVAGSPSDIQRKEEQKEFEKALMRDTCTWLSFAIAVYAIPALIFGIAMLLDAGNMAHAIWNDPAVQEYLKTHGIIITEAEIAGYITGAAALELLSGLCAAVSAFLTSKRVKHTLAVILCATAAVLCFWSVFGMFMGILVTFYLFSAKPCFVDNPEPAEEE